MPHGVAMYTAFWKAKSREVAASKLEQILADQDIKKNPYDLLCADCNCRVGLMRKSVLHAKDPERRRIRPAYYRLWPGAEHKPDCRHTPRGAVKQVVAKARTVDGMADPFEEQEGNFKFRLHMLLQRLDEVRKESDRTGNDQAGKPSPGKPEKKKVRIEQIWSDRWLEPYIRAATDLAKLWQEFVDTPNKDLLAEEITIINGPEDIAWKNFVYDDERYQVLVRHLLSKGVRKRGGFLLHPIALVVHVRDIGTTKFGSRYINCIWQELEDEDGRLTRIAPQIYAPDKVLDEIEQDTSYIVFGSPRPMDGVEPEYRKQRDGRLVRYYNLSIEIHVRKQIAPLYG